MTTAAERSKTNVKKVEKVLSLVKDGFNVDRACKEVGISKPTFYHWKKSTVEVIDAYMQLPKQARRVYAKRLKQELFTTYGLPLTLDESLEVVDKVFNLTEKKLLLKEEDEKKSNYIELTHHRKR